MVGIRIRVCLRSHSGHLPKRMPDGPMDVMWVALRILSGAPIESRTERFWTKEEARLRSGAFVPFTSSDRKQDTRRSRHLSLSGSDQCGDPSVVTAGILSNHLSLGPGLVRRPRAFLRNSATGGAAISACRMRSVRSSSRTSSREKRCTRISSVASSCCSRSVRRPWRGSSA